VRERQAERESEDGAQNHPGRENEESG
jgi:hypothetical protein